MENYAVERSLEYALNNVATYIDTDYWQPTTEKIANALKTGDEFQNPYYGQDKSPLKFEKGTQKELNAWLARERDKYPVMWLVYPVTENHRLVPDRIEGYKNVTLVLAVNRELKELVDHSLNITRPMLQSILNKFLSLMQSSFFRNYIYIDKRKDLTIEWFPNRATSAKRPNESQQANVTVEIWDTLTLTCDLYLRPDCIKPLPVIEPEPEPEAE
jgi:hypothetical protein